MTARRAAAWGAVVLLVAAGVAAAAYYLPRWLEPAEAPAPAEPPVQPANPSIKATLFYVSEDGLRLVAHERNVPFGEGIVEQARRIVEAQLAPPPPPLVSAVPAGTRLEAVYLSDNGQAFVDLSREVSAAHPGGTLNELLTVYSIVNALTTNLPSVVAVQILVDGRQVDTLAGHVDLRRPLPKSPLFIQEAETPAAVPTTR